MLKLKADKRIREYELTILAPGDFTSAELKKNLEAVEALIKKVGGKVIAIEDWGKKDLAYTIKKQGKRYHQAVYSFIKLSLDASKASELEKLILLNADVMRHLLVISSEASPTKMSSLKERRKRNS